MGNVQIDGDKRPMMYTVTGVFMGLEILAVILRFYARRLGRVHWNNDDWFLYMGLFWVQAFNILIILYVRFAGIGLHQDYVEATKPGMLIVFAKFIPPLSIVWVLSATVPKLAILQLFMKVFAIKKEARMICYATGAILVANCFATIVSALCICIPLRSLWDMSVPEQCININQLYRWARFANVLSDVVILALPIPHIVRLQTTRKLKFGLLVTFLLGGIGFVAALVTWIEYFTTNAVADKTWSAATILPWSVVEVGMYLIAACMISYKPLASRLWSGVKNKSTRLRSVTAGHKDQTGHWSWSNTGSTSTSQSQQETDRVQLVLNDQTVVTSSVSGPDAGSRIRVEHHIMVKNESGEDLNHQTSMI